MNTKKIFGSLLTVLGIGSLIYSAILFINTHGNNHDVKALVVFSVLGVLFFVAGIGLIRTTKDAS
ncbi:MAG: hypothetical protein ABIP51_19465 [Bacteroidia bacterium]